MEIKIDTKKDSTKDIQHMIDFLTRFISAQEGLLESYGTENKPSTPIPVNDGMFGMFGNNDSQSTEIEEQNNQEPENKEQFNLEPY